MRMIKKTLKRIYELLVAEGIIDEFQIDKDMWNEFKDKLGASTTSYLFFLKTLNTILL